MINKGRLEGLRKQLEKFHEQILWEESLELIEDIDQLEAENKILRDLIFSIRLER